MSLQMLKRVSNSFVPALVALLFVANTAWGQSKGVAPPKGHQVVVLLDINPHQKNVLPVEVNLAEGIIQRLSQPANLFWLITFGINPPTLLADGVITGEALASIHGVTVEETKKKYFSVYFYDAVELAIRHFKDDGRPKTLLIISEGSDYFPQNTFKETVTKARQLGIACDIAMVADHSFYGTKAIQYYGYHVRELAGKTHGHYVEVGDKQKNVARSVEKLSEGILSRSPNSM